MKKQLPVIAEFPYACPIEPFTIAFIYTNTANKGVIKGGYSDVSKFIKKKVEAGEFPACLVNFTYWRDKKAVEQTRIFGLDPTVKVSIEKAKANGTRRFLYTVRMSDGWASEIIIEKWLRRRPRKWMKDLDAFVK